MQQVRLGGSIVTDFLAMETLLDDAVGGVVEVEVERGGQTLVQPIRVQDLHAVTPASFLEVGGASLHALSYQQARNNRAQAGQVYVAEPGARGGPGWRVGAPSWLHACGSKALRDEPPSVKIHSMPDAPRAGYLLGKAGVPRFAIITLLAGTPTPDLEAFATALKVGACLCVPHALASSRRLLLTRLLPSRALPGAVPRAARAARVLHFWGAPPPQERHPARRLCLVGVGETGDSGGMGQPSAACLC